MIAYSIVYMQTGINDKEIPKGKHQEDEPSARPLGGGED
jgi:hypothetical protein